MKYKFIDFEMGAVIKKVSAVFAAFVITFGIGNAIEHVSGTYAIEYACPSGYAPATNTSNYCCPDNGYEYEYNTDVTNKCTRTVYSSFNCVEGEKFEEELETLINGKCSINGVAVQAVKYTLIINPNGGTVQYNGQTITTVTSFDVGSTISLPVPIRTGYTFKHWQNGAGTKTYSGNQTVTLTGDLSLTAIWEQNSCYYCSANMTTIWNGSVPTTTCTSDWDKKSDITSQSNCTVRTVTYVLAGGTMSSSTTAKNIHGGSVILPTPTRDGYTFKHWLNGAGTKTYAGGSSVTLTGDLTLTAIWDEAIETHDVIFDYNGGKTKGYNFNKYTVKVNDNEKVVPVSGNYEPVRDGYNFLYWELVTMGSSVTHKQYDFNTPVTKGITLYAKWEAKGGSTPSGDNDTPSGEGDIPSGGDNSSGSDTPSGGGDTPSGGDDPVVIPTKSCYVCVSDNRYVWTYTKPTSSCSSSWKVNSSITSASSCVAPKVEEPKESCYVCSNNSDVFYWGLKPNSGTNNCSGKWNLSNKPQPECVTEEKIDNPNTGSFLLYVVYLVGTLSLVYTGYYVYKVVKIKK